VLKEVVDMNKLTAYDDCTDSRLLHFSDDAYVKATCTLYYGQHGFKTCTSKAGFCQMCCNHHIGLKFLDHRNKCLHRCGFLLKGVNWADEKGHHHSSKSSKKKKDKIKH